MVMKKYQSTDTSYISPFRIYKKNIASAQVQCVHQINVYIKLPEVVVGDSSNLGYLIILNFITSNEI